MKKAISVLLIFVMVLALAACGKKEEPKPAENKATEAPATTKAAEPTPEPTKEVTPEPTQEVTPEPTQEVTPEPTTEPEPDPMDDPEPFDEPDPFDDPGYYSGDAGDGFGADFPLETTEFVDLVGSSFFGVYCQSADDPIAGSYYPYYGTEMSLETMDEFDAAFLYLGLEEDDAYLCFLERGINEEVRWSINADEFGNYILLDDAYTGEVYKGRFYWDTENERLFIQVRIGEYDLWLTDDTRLIADSYSTSSYRMDEVNALEAIERYIAATNEGLYEMIQTGDFGVADGVYTDDKTGEVVVWVRSYTGAYWSYHIDPVSFEAYVTETSPLTDNAVETPTGETLNVLDYVDW